MFNCNGHFISSQLLPRHTNKPLTHCSNNPLCQHMLVWHMPWTPIDLCSVTLSLDIKWIKVLCGVCVTWWWVKSSRESHNPLGLAKKNARHDLRTNDIPPAHKRHSTLFSKSCGLVDFPSGNSSGESRVVWKEKQPITPQAVNKLDYLTIRGSPSREDVY